MLLQDASQTSEPVTRPQISVPVSGSWGIGSSDGAATDGKNSTLLVTVVQPEATPRSLSFGCAVAFVRDLNGDVRHRRLGRGSMRRLGGARAASGGRLVYGVDARHRRLGQLVRHAA